MNTKTTKKADVVSSNPLLAAFAQTPELAAAFGKMSAEQVEKLLETLGAAAAAQAAAAKKLRVSKEGRAARRAMLKAFRKGLRKTPVGIVAGRRAPKGFVHVGWTGGAGDDPGSVKLTLVGCSEGLTELINEAAAMAFTAEAVATEASKAPTSKK